uniref:Reverse transcriptase Ty1/copia-type domain-containing protein n=1 Tax=Fagus sylvatica TaxID=28930 RepID=A0A2N9IZW8_FAGSY
MEGEKMAYKMMNKDFVKLDKFDGSNFIRWQDKMKFLLTALKIFYVLDPNLQPIPDSTLEDTEQLKQQRIKREEDELVCRGHILNTLSDRLYDLYTTMTSPKEIWKALETKYKTEKQGTDKFIIQKFLKNQMKEKELNTSEANVVDEIVAMVSEMHICMITEVHMANAAENSSEWWYDSGATIHVCNNKMLFKEYVEAGNGLEVLMGNHNTAKVLGTGTVELILSSGKKLKLTNVYHVPDIKKNLVSASLLSKNGVKAVLESDKLILSKFGVFVGKGYSCNGMYKLSLIINKNDVGCAYIVDSSLLWHARLGHLNFKYMKYMSKHGLISYKQDVLSKKIQSSPYELWNDRKSNLSYLKVWGCIAYFRVPDPKRTKLGPRAIKSVFVGYAVNSKAYRLLDLSSNTIVESRDVEFIENKLVAKGFRQREGIDYFDTYAPVARITSIRVLIALASIYKLVVHQMNVKIAFLNGDLDEEVYMDQPEGFVLPGNEKKVCKLVKSLYGLKQAPKQWHEKFDTVILANGFKHNGADKCVYSKFTSEYGVIVCLYVDDMLIFGTNMLGVCKTKKYLASVFKMKDLNEADTILGIKVKRHSEGYALCQSHYIEKVLLKYKHLNVKEVNTPFDSNYKLVENTGRAIAQLEFASAIGSMMYAMHCTRPDIAFAVNRLSRYTSNPSAEHWKAIARVLGYLKKTKDLGLYYSGYPAVLEGYSDANWVTSVGDNKSTSGWIFTLGGGAISWASKKQSCISYSTMESEFIVLASVGKEAEWLRNMLYDIELWPQLISAISIYCDSQATMSKAYSKIYNGKSRHISLRHEYVRQLLEDGVISIVYVKSSGNLADPFTKSLSRDMVKVVIVKSSRLDLTDFASLEFLPNPVYWTTNPSDWMTCTWLIQSPGLVVQSTGCRAWEFLPDSVAWTTNSGDWISAVKAVNDC